MKFVTEDNLKQLKREGKVDKKDARGLSKLKINRPERPKQTPEEKTASAIQEVSKAVIEMSKKNDLTQLKESLSDTANVFRSVLKEIKSPDNKKEVTDIVKEAFKRIEKLIEIKLKPVEKLKVRNVKRDKEKLMTGCDIIVKR
jgi:predicted patatin/cPLA2 family phospholipase